MKKGVIVYPTDFSTCANNALNFAIAMAQAVKSKIKVVHFIDIDNIIASEITATIALREIKQLEKTSKRKIKKLVDKVKRYDVECTSEIIIINRRMISWLPEYLEELSPKLVVMGTTGSGGFENKVMGSLTYKVIRNTDFPVLAVPQKASYKGFKHIIFATDYQKKDIDNLNYLVSIAQYFKASIDAVHIAEGAFSDDTEEVFLDDFKKAVGKKTSYPVDLRLLYWEDVEERLAILLKETKADLLALVTRKRNFIDRLFEKGLTKRMVYHTHTPLLAF